MKAIMDGCTAATHVAFALSDVATIYPITPVAEMGQTAQKWGLVDGRRNLMGQALDVREMESELGAAGATHGAARAGALSTTFTASQGLILMFPNMFKIAGELLPVVFHVGTRSLASHALSIYGDHQDVMSCRATGFAILASASVQETMDLALVAHLAAIDGSLPVVHMMDGWRTSNEMDTIDVIDYADMAPLVNWQKVEDFRRRASNPETPDLHGSSQDPAVFFQNREASNSYYDAFPKVVQDAMDRVGTLTGRKYGLVDYYGAPDADRVIVAIGSATLVARETVDRLNSRGEKTGVVIVRLFNPFPVEAFVKAIPETAKHIAVMSRTKEPGSAGEPLYLEALAALVQTGRLTAKVYNGRYGLSSKDFTPSMINAIFGAMADSSLKPTFTVGINDDVTHLSLDVTEKIITAPADMYQAVFYGIGADGTVGATKQAARIIGNTEGLYAQAFFEYSAKKSGGYTISQLRFGHSPITSAYNIDNADYVGCNKSTYVKRFKMLDTIKEGGTFVLNSNWSLEQMETELPGEMRRAIATKKLKFYNVDAVAIAESVGLGNRINTVMSTVFMYLCKVIPFDTARQQLENEVKTTYMHEGGDVVTRNLNAISKAVAAIQQINYPATWADAVDSEAEAPTGNVFIDQIARPCFKLDENMPVSLFEADGRIPAGTTAWEKRMIADKVPCWNPDNCIQCTECSLVCSHAAIRPFILTEAEAGQAPEDFITVPAKGTGALAGKRFRIQVFTRDCTGCGSCATVCPGHALTMMPLLPQVEKQTPLEEYAVNHVGYKENLVDRFTVKGSQLMQPLMEFSGACGGCGETPYVKLLTQLFGPRLLIANATGCSSIWGGSYPSNPYCANSEGHGPAWANSLFEDNAEFAYGMKAAVDQRRNRLADAARILSTSKVTAVSEAAQKWLAAFDDPDNSRPTGMAMVAAIDSSTLDGGEAEAAETIKADINMLGSKSVWGIGGDGWAYDIGFAGLDHVLASGENVNILVLDTECYSNTGGQTSKATPMAATAKYSPIGKSTYKKDLARMMMTYGTIYVATIALGANFAQTIRVLREAEAFNGPSIVIAYCPCINHGIRRGMGYSILEERDAVAAGYWPLMSYNPSLAQPLTVDSEIPADQASTLTFINGEDRYVDLKMVAPARAAKLQPELQKRLYSVITHLKAVSAVAPVIDRQS